MSMKPEFFITLPSNVITKGPHETNVISNYKTTLKERFVFPQNEDWSVGLAEIIYTKSWFNLGEPDPIIFIMENGEVLDFGPITYVDDPKIAPETNFDTICPGFYPNVKKLIEEINRKIRNIKYPVKRLPELFYNEITKRVTMRIGILGSTSNSSLKFIPALGEDVENILGLIDFNGISFPDKIRANALNKESGVGRKFDEIYDYFAHGYFNAPRIADINGGINAFYIYSDIVQHSCVGDAYAQLLRTIPVNESAEWGANVHLVFNKPHLVPLQSRNFDTIEIDIRDDSGSKVPFQIGRVIVKLIFKKNE